MNISDEAVEAAANILWLGGTKGPHRLRALRAALQAAAPYMPSLEAVRNAEYEAKTAARFWRRVRKTDACWLWTGKVSTNGYGVLALKYPNGRRQHPRAHRYSWELANGPIPEVMDIDHICHTPLCVRPAHLRATTRKQNLENRHGANVNSKSGVRGVYWDSNKARWTARVGHNGKNITVGRFKDLAEAEAAVIAKRNELHTHNNLDRR